jgi:serine/threonine protein kinase
VTDLAHRALTLDPKPLGKGGQGTVCGIKRPPAYADYCFKDFGQPLTTEARRKLDYQIYHQPRELSSNRFRLAWPIRVVTNGGAPVGFIMPLGFAGSESLINLTRPNIDDDLDSNFKKFEYGSSDAILNRLKVALNICAALNMLYSGGEYNIIDLKPENILVTPTGKITLVDLDSVQIRENQKIIFEGLSGTDGYKPPEGMPIPSEQIKDIYWDNFALAVVLYQVVIGAHPYAASFLAPYEQCTELSQKIAAGLFAFGRHEHLIKSRGVIHDTFRILPSDIRSLFERAFVTGHHSRTVRPSVDEWGTCLLDVIERASRNQLKLRPTSPTVTKKTAAAMARKQLVQSPGTILQTLPAGAFGLVPLPVGQPTYAGHQAAPSTKNFPLTASLLVLICALAFGLYVVWPQQQQTASKGPLVTSVNDATSPAQSKEAVRSAFQKGLPPGNNDHTKLYDTVIAGGYALQLWKGDNMGGEALLKYDAAQDQWVVVTGGGGAWSVSDLVAAGVPQEAATILLANLLPPSAAVASFYTWYLRGMINNPRFTSSPEFKSSTPKWLSSDFINNWQKIVAAHGVDPVTLSQDYQKSWISSIAPLVTYQSATTSTIVVTLGTGSEVHGVRVHLVFSNGNWLISSVTPGEAEPYEQVSYNGSQTATLPFPNNNSSIVIDNMPSPDGLGRVPLVRINNGSGPIFSFHMDQGGTTPAADLRILRLDATTRLPQIVLTSFSGGAHCCTLTKIATVDSSGNWREVDGGALDGDGGYQFIDLNYDGSNEFISLDNSFLYAFACYACSSAPTRIQKLVGTELKDVTRDAQYRTYLRERLWQMEAYMRTNPTALHSNGYLGGWVAAKALVGELDDAWRTMLANYDRQSDWILEECLTGEPLQQCPQDKKQKLEFPVALAKHLFKNNYVTAEQEDQLIAPAQAPAVTLPIQDGRYASADTPCDTAPMAFMDVISHGSPLYSPQYGECKTRITLRAENSYTVSPDCTAGSPDDPPVTTYKVISRTQYLLQNKVVQRRMRWCSGL